MNIPLPKFEGKFLRVENLLRRIKEDFDALPEGQIVNTHIFEQCYNNALYNLAALYCCNESRAVEAGQK